MTGLIISSFAIIIFAGLIHASFQLSVSMLTLLSGHSLGSKTAHRRVMALLNHFISGVFIITTTLTATLAYYFWLIIQGSITTEKLFATIVTAILASVGVATLVFYYRKGNGTSLWLPRDLAHFLTKRTKSTKSVAEAFSLGMASVISEMVFIIAPMTAAALAIVTLPNQWLQLIGVTTYVIVSLISLLIVFTLVGGGHRISSIQAWREKNKRFLQFASGCSLLILAGYIFVDRLIGIDLYGVF